MNMFESITVVMGVIALVISVLNLRFIWYRKPVERVEIVPIIVYYSSNYGVVVQGNVSGDVITGDGNHVTHWNGRVSGNGFQVIMLFYQVAGQHLIQIHRRNGDILHQKNQSVFVGSSNLLRLLCFLCFLLQHLTRLHVIDNAGFHTR